jgi:protein-S-isoprenylcysteine O-methyltransferase Ste14
MMLLFLRSIFWTILAPGVVTVYIPYLIVSQWRPAEIKNWGILQYLGLIPAAPGTAILFHCIWVFAVVGRGTLSPLDAPRHLIIHGLYRRVRNPMYLGVLLILLGEALVFESVVMLEYAAAWFILINLVILLYEEPALRRQFGPSYNRYCNAVSRWLPGKPFNPDD